MGVIIYEGPSQLDGQPIVAILTGENQKSANPKTGTMLQVWILRSDVDPLTAIKLGQDSSICGSCCHMGETDGQSAKGRDCYVNVGFAPRQVYATYKAGKYKRMPKAEWGALVAGRMVRLGAYGDPMALPLSVIKAITEGSAGWTGYTHQWDDANVLGWGFQDYLMASVDNEEEALEARGRGWRTFRVRQPEDQVMRREFICPASEEAGKKLTCQECGACNGLASGRRGDPVIIDHFGLHVMRRNKVA